MASEGEGRRRGASAPRAPAGVHGRRAGAARLALVAVTLLAASCVPLEGGGGTVEVPDDGAGVDVLAAAADLGALADVAPTVLPRPRRDVVVSTSTTVPSARPRPPASSTTTTTTPPPAPAPPPQVQAAVRLPSNPAHARALEGLAPGPTRDVAAQAVSMIRFDWASRLPGWQVRFRNGRPGYRGLTYPDSRVIEVYVRSSDTPSELAHVTAHELGHAVDVTHMGAAERASWLAARGYGSGTPWFAGSGASDFATGAGDFAESFAWSHAATGHWFGELGPPPNVVQTGLIEVLASSS